METSLEPAGNARFLYDAAVSRITGQERDLDEIRQRAATIGTLGVTATGLLGAFVLDRQPHDVVGLVALLIFIAALVALGFVLYPRSGWKFRLTATALDKSYTTAAGDADLKTLALEIDKGADDNQAKLDDLMTWFGRAVILLGVETLLWLVALAVR